MPGTSHTFLKKERSIRCQDSIVTATASLMTDCFHVRFNGVPDFSGKKMFVHILGCAAPISFPDTNAKNCHIHENTAHNSQLLLRERNAIIKSETFKRCT